MRARDSQAHTQFTHVQTGAAFTDVQSIMACIDAHLEPRTVTPGPACARAGVRACVRANCWGEAHDRALQGHGWLPRA